MIEEVEIKKYPIIRRREKDDPIELQIPICCREGHKDCKHVAKKDKPKKTNIGL